MNFMILCLVILKLDIKKTDKNEFQETRICHKGNGINSREL